MVPSRFRVPFLVQFSAALLLAIAAPISATQEKASRAASQNAANSSPQQVANFVDISEKAGLTVRTVFGGEKSKNYIIETTGTGVAVFDYDNDGWQDIFIVNGTTLAPEKYQGPQPTNHLYRNKRDGTFEDVTAKSGLAASGWGQGACAGDIDNDGNRDLFVTYYGSNRLYRNKGDGTFDDISEKGGIAGTGKDWGSGCAFTDYDRDGRLDLAIANYVDFDVTSAPRPGERASCMWKGIPVMCGPKGLKRADNLLYRNLGGGKFENVTKKTGFDKTPGHYCLSVSPLDFNEDGWPDIYLACDSTPSVLYRNNKDGTFTDVAITAGAAFNEDGREQAGMGSTIADYDGDGRLDIFKTNFSDDTSTLYKNNGNGTFTDATFAAGFGLNTQYLGWGTMFLDFDNDSWPDLLVVNGHVYPEVDTHKLGSTYHEPKILYRNLGHGSFKDVSKNGGPGVSQASSARGLAVGDLWNDGRLSAVITNMYDRANLLVNQQSYGNHWVGIQTVGTKSNRDGIGARVELRAGGRMLVNEVRSGSSYNSQSDLRVHFGLGQAAKVDSVIVKWPSGLVETFASIPVDRYTTLKEGAGKPVKDSK